MRRNSARPPHAASVGRVTSTFTLIDLPTVGTSSHRSGWPYAIKALRRLSRTDSRYLVDDYIERTFLFADHRHLGIEHHRPWVGFCHHPPELPEWYSSERLQNLPLESRWRRSVDNLRLVVTFAPHAADWISREWRKPTVTIWHPSEPSPIKWSERRFFEGRPASFVQVGTFARNLRAIESVRIPSWMSKFRLHQCGEWVDRAESVCHQHFGIASDPSLTHIPRLNNDAYDALLSRSVVFVNLLASVANNTILECLRRYVPLVVNRLAGPLHYLGYNYPLFYERLVDVYELLTEENIVAAHEYLKQRSKECLGSYDFAKQICAAIGSLSG